MRDGRLSVHSQIVQHHHAASQIVQLAAPRPAGREQALEDLHGRGDDDRHVPVLGRAVQPGRRVAALVVAVASRREPPGRRLPVEGGVVLQHVLARAEGAAEHLRRLLVTEVNGMT